MGGEVNGFKRPAVSAEVKLNELLFLNESCRFITAVYFRLGPKFGN